MSGKETQTVDVQGLKVFPELKYVEIKKSYFYYFTHMSFYLKWVEWKNSEKYNYVGARKSGRGPYQEWEVSG